MVPASIIASGLQEPGRVRADYRGARAEGSSSMKITHSEGLNKCLDRWGALNEGGPGIHQTCWYASVLLFAVTLWGISEPTALAATRLILGSQKPQPNI